MPHLAEALDRLRADNTGTYKRGRAFEKLVRNALLANPQYKDRFTNLWLWNDWPAASGVDIGIDLVGEQTEDYGGGLCAIQCKFYKSGSVSITEVNKFLSYTVGNQWRGRIFVATGNYSSNARKKLEAAETQIITSGDLDTWPVGDWRDLIDRPDDRLRWAADRHVPRLHQEEALEAVREGLFGQNATPRGRVLMPCGSGKSETALWAAERNVGWGGRVLYLVPSIALMSQTMRSWAYQRDPKLPHRYVAVCSDTKSGRDTEDADLSELAMPPTTKAGDVASKLKREAPEAMTVVFSTYQSLPVVCEAQDKGVPAFDLVICDEAHRTTGIERPKAGHESPFQLVHNEERLKARRRLFMTATQRIFASGWKKKRSKGKVYSMDDEDRYGPILYQQSFRDAIDAGLLSDYEVVVIAYSEQHSIDSYDRYQKDYEEKNVKIPKTQRLNAEDWVQLVGCWDALADPETTGIERDKPAGSFNRFYGCRRAIAFTNTIANSKKVEKHWRAVCEDYQEERSKEYRDHPVAALDVEHIDGKQNAYQRANKVQWLRGDDQTDNATRVLTNARCLSEGVDIPALDAVLFLAPRQSEVDIVQAVGRVMRRAEGKDKGYIVIPVLVPDGQTLNSEEFLKSSNFQQVWKVCRALRAHDERFDALVNAPGLAGRIPLRVIGERGSTETLELDTLPGLLPEIASVLVDRVGDRHYWPSWGQNAAGVYRKVFTEVERKTQSGPAGVALDRFASGMRATVIPTFTRNDAVEMIAQHAVTIPVFDAFFSDHSFRDVNPVSRHLNAVVAELEDGGVDFDQLIQPLERSYQRIATVFEDVSEDTDPAASKLQILQDVYEGFFKEAIPEVVKRLGIVYTPIPLVDFMLRSADAVCRKHFGKSLSDRDVEILDPFTGTGTFISRLLTITGADGEPLVSDADLLRKYRNELHANDLVLLAYYIAALKIEQSAASRGTFENGYQPFKKIVLRDTFSGLKEGRLEVEPNPERARNQDQRTIRVVITNPPWSAGQKSAGDDNPNLRYADIAERVKDTYGRRHKQVTGRAPGGNSGGNLYVQAIRWATDRLGDPGKGWEDPHGVVVFIHPNSLATGTALAGMRAAMRDEFSHVYVVNLRGDAYKSGEEFRREGDKLFGGGSRNGVQITVAVRTPDTDTTRAGSLSYCEVPEYSTLEQKFAWLVSLGDVTNSELTEVPITPRHDWVNLTDGTFEHLLPVCSAKKAPDAAFSNHARGVATSLDTYVYSFSRADLIRRINTLIDAYEKARELHKSEDQLDAVTENYQLKNIKWTSTLRQSLKRGHEIVFDESRIREVLYRPFTKLWLYEDDRILSSVKTISKMFPRDEERKRAREKREREQFSYPARTIATSAPSSSPTGSTTSTAWGPTRAEHEDYLESDRELSDLTGRDLDIDSLKHRDIQRAGDAAHGGSQVGGDSGSLPVPTPPQHPAHHLTPPPESHGGSRQPHPADPVRTHRRRPTIRSVRHRKTNPSHPAQAILTSGTSNMTFQALASGTLPDLATIAGSRQTRAIPRHGPR